MTLRDVSLAELGRRCREETLRFLRGEPRDDAFCFEIFARAVVRREDDAWETIVAQYRGIVLAYVGQHSAAAMIREPDDYWINRAFQRFWSAVGPERFGQFPDLAALLKYLKTVRPQRAHGRNPRTPSGFGQLAGRDSRNRRVDDQRRTQRTWEARRRATLGSHLGRAARRSRAA